MDRGSGKQRGCGQYDMSITMLGDTDLLITGPVDKRLCRSQACGQEHSFIKRLVDKRIC